MTEKEKEVAMMLLAKIGEQPGIGDIRTACEAYDMFMHACAMVPAEQK